MPRRYKKTKPLIYVFCEGESEQAYTDFLKKKFSDVAVIKCHSATGLFDEADNCFKKNPKYRNSAEVTDEIWFFYDVEADDRDKWDRWQKIVKQLRGMRKKPNITVRLLMTSGCVEYWLMLHFKMFAPPLLSVADKERMLAELVSVEPNYRKGNYAVTAHIAQQYKTALVNSAQTLRNLLQEGLPGLEATDERNRWLHMSTMTFSTVHEAIEYLETLV